VTTAMDVAREQWIELFKRHAVRRQGKLAALLASTTRNPQLPNSPRGSDCRTGFWMFYNRTREAKKAEFLKRARTIAERKSRPSRTPA